MKRTGMAQGVRRPQVWPKPQHAARLLLVLGLTAVFLWLLSQRLAPLDIPAVMVAFAAVSPARWGLALAATAISFWAIGQYDGVLHRHLNTGIPAKIAARAGVAAIALGQTLGAGVLTGALIRWRMMPGMSLVQATKLSAAVALSFLAGWAMVTALVLLAVPGAPFKSLAFAGCGLGLVGAGLCLFQPRITVLGRCLALPNLFSLSHLFSFALIDTVAAAAALWLLCPPDLALPFAALLPAYLLALGAGLVSGTPGGVGAFEMTLLAALPSLGETDLIAGILAFRLCYYAVPAVIGAALALRPSRRAATPRDAAPLAQSLAPAEAGLIAQNQIRLVSFAANSHALVGETPHSLTLLLDPFGGAPPQAALHMLRNEAHARGRIACLYKCGPKMAVAARAAGWHVAPIAAEAWLTPTTFTLDGPDTSALRRKLRKAEKAGVTIRALTLEDRTDLPAIAAEWATTNGGERGFSMGRFTRAHVAGQRLFGAFAGGSMIGFISFHHNAREWTLDLMRHRNVIPDGTMYALVAHAIATAAGEDVPRLSLAAAPRFPTIPTALRRFAPSPGLCQFKAAFAPRWHPLYIAAPNRAALILAGVEIYRSIHAPPPLKCKAAPDDYERNAIAPCP